MTVTAAALPCTPPTTLLSNIYRLPKLMFNRYSSTRRYNCKAEIHEPTPSTSMLWYDMRIQERIARVPFPPGVDSSDGLEQLHSTKLFLGALLAIRKDWGTANLTSTHWVRCCETDLYVNGSARQYFNRTAHIFPLAHVSDGFLL